MFSSGFSQLLILVLYVCSHSRLCQYKLKRRAVLFANLTCSANVSGDYPAPRAVLTGHDHEVVCVSVCAELGLVISGAKGECMVFLVFFLPLQYYA